MAISEFKATCLAVLKRVARTGRPVCVTRFGKPVAEIVPPRISTEGRRIGAMKGTIKITGDIVAPASDEEDWKVLRD